MRRAAKKAARSALHLTDREVSDVRALHAVGSAREMLALVNRIAVEHGLRGYDAGSEIRRSAHEATGGCRS